MRKAKRLTKRQLAVIDDLFAGKQDETAVLKEHKVSRKVFNKWLTNPAFTEQFDMRIAGAYRRSAFEIARNTSKAAKKLLQLTKSKTGETARKACLDIISMHLSQRLPGLPAAPGKKGPPPPELPRLSPQTASRLLAVLAEEKTN